MSVNLLKIKLAEHGKFSNNAALYNRIYSAARIGHNYVHTPHCEKALNDDFVYRYDHAHLSMIFHKLARILSQSSTKVNEDNWLDIAGYASLRFNEICDDKHIEIIVKEGK